MSYVNWNDEVHCICGNNSSLCRPTKYGNSVMEQAVEAQNMTTNMTNSAGNMTGTGNESGGISGLADL